MYEELAREMIEMLDSRPALPKDHISSSIRGEMAVMKLLSREGKMMAAGDISRKLSMTTARIAAVLNSLEKKAMIERCRDEEDKRRVMVRLNEKGMSFVMERKQEALEHMKKVLVCLGEADAPEYVRLMKRLMEIMPMVGPPHRGRQDNKEEKDE